jgi:hypothetical protein
MIIQPVIWFMASGSLEGAGITYEGESAKNETLVKIAGGLLGFVPLLCIPFYAIYQLIFYPKGRNFREVNMNGALYSVDLASSATDSH